MGKVGNINIMTAGVDGIATPLVIFIRGGAKVPIYKRIIWRIAEEIPANHTALIYKVDFKVL